MGVKTSINLKEAQKFFPDFSIDSLTPTTSGVIDTTYITEHYILKKYEREVAVEEDTQLLNFLHAHGLNVPKHLASQGEWHLYKKLKGVQPRTIQTYHIQALARFLSKLHTLTYKRVCKNSFINNYDINTLLKFCKNKHFLYYKKFQHLKKYTLKNDGFIHGDIFKDNTLFHAHKIAVFDFIDGGCGSFVFDAAIALVAFDANKHKPYFLNIFLRTYNQKALKKLNKKELLCTMQKAAHLYALLRIKHHKNTSKAKELLEFGFGKIPLCK